MTDREAIEELRRRDVQAAWSMDAESLAALWTEDCVSLPPGKPAVRGKAAIREGLSRMGDYARTHEILEYSAEFEELEIFGDTAVEWGTIRGADEPRRGGDVMSYEYKVMRILKKQPDGRWLVHRSIFNRS